MHYTIFRVMVIGSIQRIRLRTDFEAGLSSEHTLVATGWALARSLLPVFAQRIVSQSRENSPAAHITPILSIHHLYTIYIPYIYTQYIHASSEDEVVPPGECQPGPQQRGGWCHWPAQRC